MTNEFNLTVADLGQQEASYIETLFALTNGHLGVRRGTFFPAFSGKSNPGTFVNGFYDTEPITYGEWAYGYAQNHQTMIKLPSAHQFTFEISGETSPQSSWTFEQKEYRLDMATGMLHEGYEVTTGSGKNFEVKVTSFVSLTASDVSALEAVVTPLNFSGQIRVTSRFEKSQPVVSDDQVIDPRVASSKGELTKTFLANSWMSIDAQNSGQTVLMSQSLQTASEPVEYGTETVSVTLDLVVNQKATFHNLVFISSPITAGTEDKIAELSRLREQVTYESLFADQVAHYAAFWQTSDIEIVGDGTLQKGIRFNVFHLYQNAGRDGVTNFAAKGLTGEGYEGHYFWDTEMYMLPFFIYTQPEIAKALLTYRYSILPQAQKRAETMAQKGALFAWRTINGEEASAYYPAGTAQLHINADIAYGFQLYEKVTGDHEFMKEKGSSVIFETARFWLSYGDWIQTAAGETFQINGVTGPDEYTALVNNNYYTNKMVQNNLRYAVTLGQQYGQVDPAELATWTKAADSIKLPYDEEKQLLKQDDTFFEKAPWPFEETPKENYPLLLHYHPMVIYKHQVSKQADGLLAELLFPQDYSTEQIIRDYEFYEKVTTHDSSLSRSVFSILASRTGQNEKGYHYFMDTALMDLTDLQGNSQDGIHAANMGGSWLSLIYGFAGLAYGENRIDLHNHLPQEIQGLNFKLNIQGTVISVQLNQGTISVTVVEGEPNFEIIQEAADHVSLQMK